jgi:hypothetical protein
MKQSRKSRRVRFAAAGAVALAFGVLASLGAVSYAAKLVGVTGASPVALQYPPSKVTICHHTHSQKNPFVTITISERALPAHLAHGDTVGACSPLPATAPATKHGKNAGKHLGKGKQKSHLTGHERSALRHSLKSNRGHGKSGTHGHAGVQTTVQTQASVTHGKGLAKGHDKQHKLTPGTHGNGQAGTHGQGNGHGNGTGGGQGTGNGNPGGGKDHQKKK